MPNTDNRQEVISGLRSKAITKISVTVNNGLPPGYVSVQANEEIAQKLGYDDSELYRISKQAKKTEK